MTVHVSAEQLPKAIFEKMASEEFKVREEGQRELREWAKKNTKTAPEILHDAWKQKVDPELKSRCFDVMRETVLLRRFGPGPGFVGIQMVSIILQAEKPDEVAAVAVRISNVLPNTPGKRAGLLAGDIIVGIDQVDLNKPAEGELRFGADERLTAYIKSKHPDDVITLRILRLGKKMDKDVKLMLRPDSADILGFGQKGPSRKEVREQFFQTWLKERAG